MLPKIPDMIYENRCRYCIHFQKDGENRDYKATEVFSCFIKPSCKILGVASYCYQIPLIDGNRLAGYTSVVYPDGECRSFTPHLTYPGICRSCQHHNFFAKEEGYCNGIKASDYKKVFIGNNHGSEAYESDFYTCSNWKIKESWKDLLLRDIAAGKVPNVIDSKTFKLIEQKHSNQSKKPKRKEQKVQVLKLDL